MLIYEAVQGFLGVLSTILVLLILADKSNFIYSRLKRYSSDTTHKLNHVKLKIKELSAEILKNPEYMRLRGLKSLLSPENTLRLLDIDRSYNRVSLDFSLQSLKPAQEGIKRIKESKEIIFAPFYAILFVITLFLSDIIQLYWPDLKSSVITFLSILTALSVIYWIMIWIRFWTKDMESADEILPRENSLHPGCAFEGYNRIYHELLIIFGSSCLAAVLCLRAAAYTFGLAHAFERIGWIILPLLVFVPLGLNRIKRSNRYPVPSYRSLLYHFVAITLCSLLYTLVFIVPFPGIEDVLIPIENKNRSLILSSLLFILIFGIILPFYIPYRRWAKDQRRVRKEAEKKLTELQTIRAHFLSEVFDLETTHPCFSCKNPCRK